MLQDGWITSNVAKGLDPISKFAETVYHLPHLWSPYDGIAVRLAHPLSK